MATEYSAEPSLITPYNNIPENGCCLNGVYISHFISKSLYLYFNTLSDTAISL